MQCIDQIQRALGVGAAFHIDTHKDAIAFGTLQHLPDVRLTQRRVNIQPKRRELNRDIRIQTGLLDGIKNLAIILGRAGGFASLPHILAQMIERDSQTPLIEGAGGLDSLFQPLPRNKPPGAAAPQAVMGHELTNTAPVCEIQQCTS